MFKKGEKIEKFYKIGEVLGEGSFAVVRKATRRKTGEDVAVKIFKRATLSEDDELALRNEVEILSQLYEIFEDEDNIYLVLELMTGGELFDRVVDKEHYSEKEAADTIRPIVDAIKYCHSLGIVHRDLKPENLLYATKDAHSVIKISDFGLARFMNQDLMTTACGTPGYVAPEVIKGAGYNKSVDFWSIGVILYILLCGFPPFYADSNEELFDQIKKGKYDFPSPHWDQISDMAKELISKILVVDPSQRLGADGILGHTWVIGEKTPRKQLPHVTSKIREFNAKRKFKKLAMVAIAAKKIEILVKERKDKLAKK